jgi:hypothetical protein
VAGKPSGASDEKVSRPDLAGRAKAAGKAARVGVLLTILRASSKTRKIRKIKIFLHLDMPSGKRRGVWGNTVPPSNKYAQNTLPHQL